jgi:transposase-like protein
MPQKVCSSCGGDVDVELIGEHKDESTICFARYIVGTCQSCGKTFTEAELLALENRPTDNETRRSTWTDRR